jgi:NSS family neurotransmitter:Na+ symporter
LIIFNTDTLFGLIVTLTTEYSQPLLGLCLCLYAGWVINRNSLLAELRSGNPTLESSLFWKIWPFYVRYICPLLIAVVLLQQFF